LRAALARSRVRRWPVPRLAQIPVRALLAPLGLVAPTAQLDYIRYDWTVSAAKAQRELHVGSSDPANVRSAHDPFGMDIAYIDALGRRLLRFLHDVYWRVELDGLEHVPRDGPVVLVGVHRGFFPWDGMMILHALATRAGRYPRFLIHPGLLKFPFFFNLFRKMGGLPATQNNADYVLRRDGALGVFPEGVDGAFRLYRDAYRLGRFGRGGFVKTALLNGAPIVPFVTVGSAEASPVLAKISSSWWRRYAMWPCIPITPTLLPLPLPLPSKWHTRFLPRIDLEVPDRTAAARDHAFVREVTRAIHEGMQAELDSIRERRPSVLAGNVFDDTPRGDGGERH
jgi:1-acyl-sn-glycerol-3-phosphate acyltransferase